MPNPRFSPRARHWLAGLTLVVGLSLVPRIASGQG